MRALAGLALAVGAVAAPFSWVVRLGVLGLNAAYLLWSALSGSCVGYRLMGRSTCPARGH